MYNQDITEIMMAEGVFAKVCPEQYADTSIFKKGDDRQKAEGRDKGNNKGQCGLKSGRTVKRESDVRV